MFYQGKVEVYKITFAIKYKLLANYTINYASKT